jgi:hypothetical protein
MVIKATIKTRPEIFIEACPSGLSFLRNASTACSLDYILVA